MKKRRNGLVTILLLLAVSSMAGPMIPFIAILVPVLTLVGLGFAIALVVGALKGNKDSAKQEAASVKSDVNASSGRTIVNKNYTKSVGSKSKLDPEQQELVQEAGGQIQKAVYVLNTIKDTEIKTAAEKMLAKANWIVKTLKEQPEEIRKSNQFFNYYLPTIKVVFEKYRTIEQSGLDVAENKQKVLDFCADTDKAFDAMYEGFFKDEKLDLEVEVEAMQMALKRDGLV